VLKYERADEVPLLGENCGNGYERPGWGLRHVQSKVGRLTYQGVAPDASVAAQTERTRARAVATVDASTLLLALVLIASTAHPAENLVLAVFVLYSFALLVLTTDLVQRQDLQRRAFVEIVSVPIVLAASTTSTLVAWRAPDLGTDAAVTDAIVPWVLATAYVVAGRVAFAWAASNVPVASVAEVLDLVAKRIFDLVVAGAMLVLLAPVAALVAAAIWLDDRGPVFYRCRRIGERGEPLEMLKFRKMRQDADGPPLSSADDDRFTRVGRILAQSKLDELPQLWNVLRGEMSLVGPRPEDPAFVAMYPAEYERIARVRPGITGLCQLAFAKEAQIIGREDHVQVYTERLLPQKLAIDLLYAERRTFLFDLKIACWTVAVLLRKDVAVDRRSGELTFRRRRVSVEPASSDA
jgi:lipopolysaccharide/colanic/teichoic acid biosynthesis glycosyltransferase